MFAGVNFVVASTALQRGAKTTRKRLLEQSGAGCVERWTSRSCRSTCGLPVGVRGAYEVKSSLLTQRGLLLPEVL